METFKEKIGEISLFLFLGLIVSGLSEYLKSDFLDDFFKHNLMEVLVVMFSINITVIGLTVTKIKEFAGERMRIFAPVISELRLTIWYQIVMIAV